MSNILADDLRDIPIPLPMTAMSPLDYHSADINSRNVRDINSRDARNVNPRDVRNINPQDVHNREPLVDLVNYHIACRPIYASSEYPPYYRAFPSALDTVLLRQGAAQQLVQVNQELLPYKVELLALDGFRPIELQQELWKHFIDEAKKHLPYADEEEAIAFAKKYCSDPRQFDSQDFVTWPLHFTGGAIDITLQFIESQQPLDMGSGFDEVSDAAATGYFELQDAPSSQTAPDTQNVYSTPGNIRQFQRNRRLLYHAMQRAGFANYPHEWWHFDLAAPT